MKICWDNLNKLRYSKRTGKWYRDVNGKIAAVYVYKEECEVCKEPFISQVKRGGDTYGKYCTIACGNKVRMLGKKLSPEACEKISKIHKNKITSEETKKKLSESLKKYYGNYDISISKYDVYAHQLEWCEEVRRNSEDSNILEIKCTYCGKWYVPRSLDVKHRSQAINGNYKGELRLYCSEGCKKACPIFNKSYLTLMKEDAIRAGRLNWIELNREVQPQLRQMVLKKDGYKCIKCKNTDELHCHHIYPVATDPLLSADVDNCITLCVKCHKQVHKQDGCKYVDLRCNN